MADHTVRVRISRNGGYTFGDWRERDLGEVGDFMKRVRFTQFGKSRQFVIEIAVSSPRKADLIAAAIEPETAQ
jgi:hypothetical protein